MRDLINNLLDLSRIEAGTLSVVAEPTDVADVVDRARKAFLSGGYRNSIEVEVMPGLPRVAADGRRIVQVLHNLFSNASTYSREWSPIRVTALLHDALVGFELLERIRTDFPHPGHRPVRPARPGHRQGVRARSRGLCCIAVRPGRTRGQDRSSAPSGCRTFPHAGIEPYRHGDLVINYLERSVTVAGEPVRLTPTEHKLLFELSRYPGRVLTHDQLLKSVWSQDHPADQRLLRSFIKKCARSSGTTLGIPRTSSRSPVSVTASQTPRRRKHASWVVR